MQNNNFEIWVNIFGIIINAILAYLVVTKIQKNQDNERQIKNHFINEIIEFRSNWRDFLNGVYSGKKYPNDIISSLKLLSIKSKDLINLLAHCFEVEKEYFNSYFLEINKIISEDPNFISSVNPKNKVELTNNSIDLLLKFQSNNQYKFNDLILRINDSNYKRIY